MDILAQLLQKAFFSPPSNCLLSTFHFIYFGELQMGYKLGNQTIQYANHGTPARVPESPGVAATASRIHLSWDLRQVFQSLHLTTHCYPSLTPQLLEESPTWSPSFLHCQWRPGSTFPRD